MKAAIALFEKTIREKEEALKGINKQIADCQKQQRDLSEMFNQMEREVAELKISLAAMNRTTVY